MWPLLCLRVSLWLRVCLWVRIRRPSRLLEHCHVLKDRRRRRPRRCSSRRRRHSRIRIRKRCGGRCGRADAQLQRHRRRGGGGARRVVSMGRLCVLQAQRVQLGDAGAG
jgi:hypothetical protein